MHHFNAADKKVTYGVLGGMPPFDPLKLATAARGARSDSHQFEGSGVSTVGMGSHDPQNLGLPPRLSPFHTLDL